MPWYSCSEHAEYPPLNQFSPELRPPIASEVFQNSWWVHWPGLQGLLGHLPTAYALLYDQMGGMYCLIIWPLSAWQMVCCSVRSDSRCFWCVSKHFHGCIGQVCKDSLGIHQPYMHHSMIKWMEYICSLFNQSKSQSQSQLSGPLSSWQIVYCNVRIDSHCSWGVSRHFMGVLARFARLPWESTNLICITLCPNVRNVLAHYLASAWVRSSQVGPYPHGKWCVAT